MALLYQSEEDPAIAPLFRIISDGEMELEDLVVAALDKDKGDLLHYDESDVYKTMYDLMDETEQMIDEAFMQGGVTRVKLFIDNINRSLSAAVSEGSCITDDNYSIGTWYNDMIQYMKDTMEGKVTPAVTAE